MYEAIDGDSPNSHNVEPVKPAQELGGIAASAGLEAAVTSEGRNEKFSLHQSEIRECRKVISEFLKLSDFTLDRRSGSRPNPERVIRRWIKFDSTEPGRQSTVLDTLIKQTGIIKPQHSDKDNSVILSLSLDFVALVENLQPFASDRLILKTLRALQSLRTDEDFDNARLSPLKTAELINTLNKIMETRIASREPEKTAPEAPIHPATLPPMSGRIEKMLERERKAAEKRAAQDRPDNRESLAVSEAELIYLDNAPSLLWAIMQPELTDIRRDESTFYAKAIEIGKLDLTDAEGQNDPTKLSKIIKFLKGEKPEDAMITFSSTEADGFKIKPTQKGIEFLESKIAALRR